MSNKPLSKAKLKAAKKQHYIELLKTYNIYAYTRLLSDLNASIVYTHVAKCFTNEYFCYKGTCSDKAIEGRISILIDSIKSSIFDIQNDMLKSNLCVVFKDLKSINVSDTTTMETIHTIFKNLYDTFMFRLAKRLLNEINSINSDTNKEDDIHVNHWLKPIADSLKTLHKVQLSTTLW